MKQIFHRTLRILAPALVIFPLTTAAFGETFPDTQRDEIKDIVREYLLENPEIITEALNVLELRQKQAEETARIGALSSLEEQIFNSENQVVLGNPDGDVTLVEFFDYNCGFCKRAHQDMVQLMESDPNLRVVLKEFPVLGQGSVEAARVSVAVNELAPEKFEAFHLQLLLSPGQANQAKAIKTAVSMGVDQAALEAAVEGERAAETIQEVYTIADALGLTGTPSYVVGTQVVFGAVGAEQLRESIAKARDEKS